MLMVCNVGKEFPTKKGNNVNALQNIDLKFNETGLVCITGESGAGKSTLLSILSLNMSPTYGKVYFNNNEVNRNQMDSLRNHITYLKQSDSLLDYLSVYEFLCLSLTGKKQQLERINELLESMCLTGYEDRKIKELSGGERQRVSIIKALLQDTPIILLDEPTESLDMEKKELVYQVLKKQSKEKLVVIVSHEPEMISKYATRVITLSNSILVSDELNKKTPPLEVLDDEFYVHSFKDIFEFFKKTIQFTYSKKIMMIMMIILSTIFLLCSTTRNNHFKVSKQNFEKYGIEMIIYEQSKKELFEYGERYVGTTITGNDLIKINENMTSKKIYPIFMTSVLSMFDQRYVMEVDETIFEDTQYTLIEGRFPVYNEDKTEVMVSKVMAEEIMRTNMMCSEDCNDYSQLIDLNIDSTVITGVLDTMVDKNDYQVIKEFVAPEKLIHNFAFVPKGTFLKERSITTINQFTASFKVNKVDNHMITVGITDDEQQINILKKRSGGSGTPIYIPLGDVVSDEEYRNLLMTLILEYVKDNVKESPYVTEEEYQMYILHNSDNEYNPEKNKAYFEQVLTDELFEEFIAKQEGPYYFLNDIEFECLGFSTNGNHLVDEDGFVKLYDDGVTVAHLFAVPLSNHNIFQNEFEEQSFEEVSYDLEQDYWSLRIVKHYFSDMQPLVDVVFVFSIVAFLVTSFLMYQSSTKFRYDEIAFMESINISKKNIRIYLVLDILFLLIPPFVLSLAFSSGLIEVINKFVFKTNTSTYNRIILQYDIISHGFVSITCIITAFILLSLTVTIVTSRIMKKIQCQK